MLYSDRLVKYVQVKLLVEGVREYHYSFILRISFLFMITGLET